MDNSVNQINIDSVNENDGYCVIKYSNKDIYTGEININNFIKHGYGKYYYLEKNDNIFNITNKLIMYENITDFCEDLGNNMITYEGFWKNDLKHGDGKYTNEHGDIYEGEWKNDKLIGNVKIFFNNGNNYEGELFEMMMFGKGVYLYKNNNKYIGEFKCNKIHGYGKITFNNGDIYEGEFENNEMHGKGMYKYANRDIDYCTYKNNILIENKRINYVKK